MAEKKYGMTPQGFIPKRLAHILTDLNANIADIADQKTGSFPFQNASDDSILQQVTSVFAEGLSECWAAAYDAAVQFDPLKNSGAGQKGTVQLNAMLLKPGSYTLAIFELTGANGTTIPKGSLMVTADGLHTYATNEPVHIFAPKGSIAGTAHVTAKCTVKGTMILETGHAMSIRTPVSGWNNATVVEILVTGREQENEGEIRRRQQRSTSLTSYRQIEAIYAAVLNVPGVIYCRAYQNQQYYPVDDRGIPFKEVAVVAEGGAPRAIAEALFLRFPVGVIGYGNTTEVFYDKQNVSYAISFSRPVEVPVAVSVDITVTNRSDFPDDGIQRIKEAIIDYAEYGGEGNIDGFPPGSDILCSRLYTPVNTVAGHKINRLALAIITESVEPVFTVNDIVIAWNQVGRFDHERITVNVIS